MSKTIPVSDSPSLFFLDQLHRAGVKDAEIDGSVADDATGGPNVGVCRDQGPKDGKVEASEIFAVAFNNLVKHGETLKRYFQKLDLPEVAHLQNDGQFDAAYLERTRKELSGSDPQRSLKAWPNPKKLSPQAPNYAAEWVQWASRHTRLSLLPYKDQVEAFKQAGLSEAQVKGELTKLWKGQTLPKMVAHASVLRGEEMLREAREQRGIGDTKQAQGLEKSAARLFRTAVELDGNNPSARRHWAQVLETQGRFREAGLHYVQALRTEPEFDLILGMLDHLSEKNSPDLLGKFHDAYSLVGFTLKDAGRPAEAALIFHRAAEAATKAGQHERSLAFTEQEMLADETKNPYVSLFSSNSNPVANALYSTLRDAGIPSALIDGASGKEGDVPDRKITAAEVFGYLDGHLQEPRVQAALQKVHFQIPWLDKHGHLKKEFDTPEFAKQSFAQRMASWHAGEAALLQKSSDADSALVEKHLKMATYYTPDRAEAHRALGDFYLARKDGVDAKASYLTAVSADPLDTTISLSLARAQTLVGEHGDALKSYDLYLAKHPEDTAAKSERDASSSRYLDDRIKKFDGQLGAFQTMSRSDPAQAEKILEDLDATRKEILVNLPGTPAQSFERIQRLRTYNKAVIDFREARPPVDRVGGSAEYNSFVANVRELSSELKGYDQALRDLRDQKLRPDLAVAGGETTPAQIDQVKLALRIDRELGEVAESAKDLVSWQNLVKGLPASTPAAQRAGAYAEILQTWEQTVAPLKDNPVAAGAASLVSLPWAQDLKKTILETSPEAQSPAGRAALTSLLDHVSNPRLQAYFSESGLKLYVQQSAAADTAFQAAKQVGEVKQQRAALLTVLGQYAKLGQDKNVEATVAAIDATFPQEAKDSDRLIMLTGMLATLKGSGLSQEKALREKGTDLARGMSVCSADSRLRAQRLMIARSYYEVAGDTKGKEENSRDLRGLSDDLLNFLYSGDPKTGIPKPTDSKQRLDIATQALEIDLALLPEDATATDPKSKGAIAVSMAADRMQVLRREIVEATDLPVEARMEKLAYLARMAETYTPLTKGAKPMLAPENLALLKSDLKSLTDEVLKTPFAEDPKAVKELGAAAERLGVDKTRVSEALTQAREDFKARFREAIEKGDKEFLSQVTPASIQEYTKLAAGGHLFLMQAGNKQGPRAMEARMKAAAVFSSCGLKDRVKESLEPVRKFALLLPKPEQRAGLLLNLSTLYQQAGSTESANEALQGVVDMGGKEEPPALQELATLATGLQHLNRHENKEAEALFATIPQNPVAQAYLSAAKGESEKRRIVAGVAVLRSIGLNFLDRGKEATFGGFSKDEYADMRRDTLAGWDEVQRLMLNGECKSFDQAIARVSGDERFPGFRTGFSSNFGADPHKADTSEFHVASATGYFLSRLQNPMLSDEEFGKAALDLGGTLEADGYYGSAGQIYALLQDHPNVGPAAKDLLEALPASAKIRSGINIAWSVITFAAGPAGIVAGTSTSSAGGADYVENVAMALIPFGVARAFALGAEAVYVARAASLIRNPLVREVTGFVISKGAEAAGFTLGNMGMLTLFKGKTDQWTLGHFGKEFGTMFVTFVLLHGSGMMLQGLGRGTFRFSAKAEADLARALESGSGVGQAALKYRLAASFDTVARSGVTAWASRVASFTGAEYFNEAIGLKDAEPGIPFGVRLFSSAVMDLQMSVAGKTLNRLSGGRMEALEASTRKKYFALEVGLTIKSQFGLDPESPQGQHVVDLLLFYASQHPLAAPGLPLKPAEAMKLAGELRGEVSQLLTGIGLERGPSYDSLQQALLSFAMVNGMDPKDMATFTAQAGTLKKPLQHAVDALLGPDAGRTPEGAALRGELLFLVMSRSPSPDKMLDTLQGLIPPIATAKLHEALSAQAQLVLGKGGEESPAGRELMSFLLRRALYRADSAADLPDLIRAGGETLSSLPELATVTGLTHPQERLALARWALEQGVAPEVVSGMARLVLKGKLELRFTNGELQVLRVSPEQQAAKAKEVLDRLPELPSDLLKEDRAAVRVAEETILPVTEDMIVATEATGAEGKAGDKNLGDATFKPITAIEAQADKIAKAKPNAERLARYVDYLMKKNPGLKREEAEAQALQWAEQVILDARTHQLRQTHIYDTSLPVRPETQHLDQATIDHHGRFGNPKNATEQLLDRMEATLDTVRGDRQALKDVRSDQGAMRAADGDTVVAAALRELNLREVTTDNLADGGWCVWIAKNQARVLRDPELRKLIGQATHFEDFTAFGTKYDSKDPAIRLQAALFEKYGEILKANGIVGSDRFPPEKAEKVMGEALKAIDQMVDDPAARETAAAEFFQKVEAARAKAGADAVMGDASVHEGNTNLSFFDLTKLGDFTVFQQWLALPRVEVSPGTPHTLQVSVVPMKPAMAGDGSSVPRTLQIVAIPDGRSLPSGKGLLTVLDRINAAEKAKAEKLGVEPNNWFGKDNVILPNPMKGGTLLSPKEVSQILTSAELGLFNPPPQEVTNNARPSKLKRGRTPPVAPEAQVIAARRGLAVVPAENLAGGDQAAPMPAAPGAEAVIPEVSFNSGGVKTQVSIRSGEVLPLGVQDGKLQVGDKVKAPLAELEVLKDEKGQIQFYLRRSGQADRLLLKPGSKVQVGDAEFEWEGPQPAKRPDLQLVPEEPTSKGGLPSKVGPSSIKGKPELSKTEIEAHVFLDFYFGESGSYSSVKTLSERGSGENRDWVAEQAADFSRGLLSFRSKVARYDELEKTYIQQSEEFKAAEGKDPAKRIETARLAEAALSERKALEVEIEKDLRSLQASTYNRIELQFNERVVRSEKELIPLDFALATAQVEATIAVRGTNETPALYYENVYKPMLEIPEAQYDKAFSGVKLGDLVQTKVHVTQWEAAERAVALMVEEGVLKPEQVPDFAQLKASGASEWTVQAELPGEGPVKVSFLFEGKVEAPVKEADKAPGAAKAGGTALASMFLGLGTLLVPETARAADQVGASGDGSIVPWMLGIGAAVAAAGLGAFWLWARGRSPAGGDQGVLAQRRATADKLDGAPQGPVLISAKDGVGVDLVTFLGDRPSLAQQGRDFGLSQEKMVYLESLFERGGSVDKVTLDPKKPPRIMVTDLVSGAHTISAQPGTEGELRFYEAWKKEYGFPPVDAAKAQRAWKDLQQRAKSLGITIEFPGNGAKPKTAEQIAKSVEANSGYVVYLNELLKLLPDSMLKNPYLKRIRLGTSRSDAAQLSRYDEATRSVDLFSGTLSGARRYLAALVFHEVGHSTAERYMPGPEGDASIPEVVRDQMFKAQKVLAASPRGMVGLDWSMGPQARADYQGSFTEFLAELNLVYVAAGPKLRAHIESFPKGSPERKAWDFVYGEMKSRIFGGVEYGYDGQAQAKPLKSPVLTAVPVKKAAPVAVPVAKSQGPVSVPVPGPVDMALADNAPGKPREGTLGRPATAEYGSFKVITNEGVGYKTDHNEDGYVQGRNWGLVLDGMGGMSSGDKASELAGKKFAEEMAQHGDMVRAMVAAGHAVNVSPYRSGGAVAVAHQVVRNPDGSFTARIVHVGDAGAIVFRRNAQGEFEQVFRTEEQSVAAYERKLGKLHSTMEMRISPQANVVLGGLGVGRKAEPVYNEVPLQKGDVILSFSDGVGDNVSRQELSDILKTAKTADEVATKVDELVQWKMGQLAKAKSVARGKSKDGTVLESSYENDSDGRQIHHWKVQLTDMPGYTINDRGNVFNAQGQLVDHYKADNVTIHAYVHDITAEAGVQAKGLPPPTAPRDFSDMKTVIIPNPIKGPTVSWTPNGEWLLPEGFKSALVGSDADKGATILVRDTRVSGTHAEILEGAGEYWLRDSGSTNGTYWNGKKLGAHDTQMLSSGDILTFANQSYQWDLQGQTGKLTPVLSVPQGQSSLQVGPATFLQGTSPGVYFIRNDGTRPLIVGGSEVPADGNAYRIRDREIVQLGAQNFVFRQFNNN